MVAALVPLAIAGGAVWYVTSESDAVGPGATPVSPVIDKPKPRYFPAATMQQTMALSSMAPPPKASNGASGAPGRNVQAGLQAINRAPYLADAGNWIKSNDTLVQQKVKEAEAYAKKAYKELGSQAKKAGAEAMNETLGTSLTGEESWEDMSRIAGAALGAAAGGYIGGPLGAKIGAIMGAYLGVKLEEWLSGAWDKIEDWASDAGSALGDAAESAYNYVSDLW